jgi:hypothetical protein
MRSRRFLIAAIVVLILFYSGSSSAQVQEATLGVRVTPERVTVCLHEPVSVVLALKNDMEQPLSLDLGDDRISNIEVDVFSPDGRHILHHIPTHQGLARIGRITIAAGQSYSQTLVLNNWTDFREVGIYRLQIRFLSRVLAADGRSTNIGPLASSVMVEDRDEQRLTKLCAQLLDSLLKAKSYDDAHTQAMLLRYIGDPTVVPFLERAIEETAYPVQSLLVVGLESVDTPEAVRSLLRLISKHSPAVPDAKVSLSRMVPKIADVDLRKQVQEVLEVN